MIAKAQSPSSWIRDGWGSAIASLGVLAVLILLQQLAPHLPTTGPLGFVRFLVAEGRGRNPIWWVELRQANNGYYEALMTRTSDPNARDRTLLSRLWASSDPVEVYRDHPFLGYLGKPNLRAEDPFEGPQITNSQGLFDSQEHTFGPAPEVRRLAFFGDSITRGWGLAPEKNYASLVTQELNRDVAPQLGKPFELLNFSVTGYRVTQLYGTAMEMAPKYKPDVYLFTLGELTTAPDWASHLFQLVQSGSDLRYDFLKEAVRDSGVRPDDSPVVAQKKLAAYQIPVLREILNQMKALTQREGAGLLLVVVTAAEDTDLVKRRLKGLDPVLAEMKIPVISLVETYKGVDDIETMRRQWYDGHPNEEGHRRLAETFLKSARSQPEVWRILTGVESPR